MIDSKTVLYSKGSNDECYTPMGGGLSDIKIYSERLGGLVSF